MSSEKYLSPSCSCIVCKQLKSAKGIHSHYLAAHTEEGNTRVRKSSLLGASKGGGAYAEIQRLETIQKEIEYASIDGFEHGAWGWAEQVADEKWKEFQESFSQEEE